ncbi:MAG: translocation/assembly module TamB domain-containing protein, partial [Saezia sp.]
KLHNEGKNLAFELLWDTGSAGVISVDLATLLSRDGNGWTVQLDAPLSGTAIAQLPELSAASAFFPTGWRFGGAAILDTEVYGTVQAPELKGKLTALGVSLRSIIDGLSFTDGEVDIAFDSQQVRLNKFVLHGVGNNGGDMIAQGYFTLPEKGVLPVVELNVALNKLKASIHSDRELTLSGKLQMGFKERSLSLTGSLNVDRALIIIDHDGAPSLDDDVVVISGKYATNTVDKVERPRRRDIYGITPLLNVKLDLGKDFRIQGYGLQTYLNGELGLSNSGWNPMLIGTIHTARGRFKAYGQHLNVEKGNIVFSGNPMNPSLDVLAIRPQTQERVGVNIIGTAIHPKIRLYSESGLPESEALSWLILGRPTSSDGTEMAILQQAALALASGDGVSFTDKIAGSLGLDEISLGGSSSGNEDSISATTVTIGKRLGEKFYISYEQGLNNAMGTFFVFYDISRRLTLRAQTGEDTALDVIYTFRFDGKEK